MFVKACEYFFSDLDILFSLLQKKADRVFTLDQLCCVIVFSFFCAVFELLAVVDELSAFACGKDDLLPKAGDADGAV